MKIRQAQIQQFKSDFRVVAEFFSQKRKQLDYTPSNQQLQHAKEVLQLFSIMTDDARFEDIYNEELEKGEGGQGGGKDGVSADGKTIVVFSDDLDRALASFVIADGAASAGRKVTLFFTFWGLNVIKRKATVPVKKDMAGKLFGMMLPSGSRKLALSKLNLGGIGSRMMRGMMKNKKIDSLETLMEQAKANGVEFIACRMSMEVMGIKAEELLDGVKIGGVATYLERAEQANINLFI